VTRVAKQQEPVRASGIEIRPLTPADLPAVVGLIDRADPYRPLPATVDDFALTQGYIVDGGLDLDLVAIDRAGQDPAIVGHAWIRDEAWPPDAYFMVLYVDPAHRRRGLGSELLDRLIDGATERGGRREVATFVAEQDEAGAAFARARGFVEGYRLIAWSLDPTAFDTAAHPPRPTPAGIRLATLADVDGDDVRHALHAMAEEAAKDVPTLDQEPPASFEDWERQLLAIPRFSPHTLLLAMDGPHPVAYCLLGVDGERAHNHFTAVARSHRGKGLAWNIKLASIELMRSLGVRDLRTENHTGNAGMLAINERLGFTRIPGFIRFGRRL
jgi:GNAT superfamily N-acetyltransferase